MKEGYDFRLNLDDWSQVGDNRFFEIEATSENVSKFIEDSELFKEEDNANS